MNENAACGMSLPACARCDPPAGVVCGAAVPGREGADPLLADAYTLISELWCSPPPTDAEREALRADAGRVVAGLAPLQPDAAASLTRFLGEPAISEEDYIDLFELQPRCPLYLGSHVYDEPKTCAGAGVSDRNEYMIELVGVFRHFGRSPSGNELPDYLPLIVEFLALTADSPADPVRIKLLQDYVLPFLPPIRSRLQEIGTPYLHLLDAFQQLASSEVPVATSSEASNDR